MIYLVILLLFWKPIYWGAKYLYVNFYLDDKSNSEVYKTSLILWFGVLYKLLVPSREEF